MYTIICYLLDWQIHVSIKASFARALKTIALGKQPLDDPLHLSGLAQSEQVSGILFWLCMFSLVTLILKYSGQKCLDFYFWWQVRDVFCSTCKFIAYNVENWVDNFDYDCCTPPTVCPRDCIQNLPIARRCYSWSIKSLSIDNKLKSESIRQWKTNFNFLLGNVLEFLRLCWKHFFFIGPFSSFLLSCPLFSHPGLAPGCSFTMLHVVEFSDIICSLTLWLSLGRPFKCPIFSQPVLKLPLNRVS